MKSPSVHAGITVRKTTAPDADTLLFLTKSWRSTKKFPEYRKKAGVEPFPAAVREAHASFPPHIGKSYISPTATASIPCGLCGF